MLKVLLGVRANFQMWIIVFNNNVGAPFFGQINQLLNYMSHITTEVDLISWSKQTLTTKEQGPNGEENTIFIFLR